ncbi:alpha/beta fold hydrolase [Streptomyces poonensis]|uniref:Alpha/beta hydrolase n=1 Tax=Streptomyces poonensis TaxID=68255 RepID=A0A918UF37_9ACTN|nr:alpha/beta fold hydrolase [Streptomyces poonensis]GGZ02895.1 alpha/beta hydrolase [Streptomyces poonensis]GLJ93858.1 alpha/beta hydrolase [Streptomyces poonensis]
MRLATRVWGDGPRTAVLVHGIMTDSRTWRRVAPAIAEHGYRVVAVDLRGHGASGATDTYTSDPYTPATLAADLLDTLPPAPDLAIAHSLGSAALLLAVPGLRCARAVHCDPAWLRRPRDLDALRAVKHATWRELRAAHPRWHHDDITDEQRALATWDPESVEALLHLPGLPDTAPAVPSLVLLADPSERVPPAEAATLRRCGWQVRTVDGAGHTVHRDDPAGFLAGLRGWL